MLALRRTFGRARRLRTDVVARDTVWGTGLEGLQLAVMLLSFTLLGKQLGPVGFGAYASMYALIGILGGLVYSGVGLAVVQHLVRDKDDLTRVLTSCLGLVLLAGSAGAALGTAIGHYTVPEVSVRTVACFMLAELLGTATIELMAAAVYAREGVAVAARYRLVPLLTKLTVLLTLYATGQLTIAALGAAYLLLYPVMAVGVAVSVGRRYGVRIRPGRPSTVHVRSSGLYATTISAIALQNDGDKVVLGAAKLGAEVGLYAAAYRLVSMGTVPLRALLGASHRRFLEHDPTVRNQHLRRAVTFACVGVGYGIVFGGALFLAAPLVTLLLGDEFRGAVVMLQVLAPVVAVRSVAEFGLNGLLGFGRVGVRTTVTIIAALTAMVLYLLLIPTMGWQGAVIGTYASELLLAGLAWTALIRFQLQHNAGLLPKGDVGTPGEPLPSAHGVPASDARGR